MKLLLLLSALLGALTGVSNGVRVGPAPAAQAAVALAIPNVVRVARQVAIRPLASILTVARKPLQILAPVAPVVSVEPRFGERRRE